jgi:DNA-binding NarL/FixJ family response regulator
MMGKLVAAFQSQGAPEPSRSSPRPRKTAPQLSPREEEVLREIARGASNKEIARTLDIAETTVKIHVQHILRKLGLSSRVQAAVYARTASASNRVASFCSFGQCRCGPDPVSSKPQALPLVLWK